MRNIQKQFGYQKCVCCMENSGKAFKSLSASIFLLLLSLLNDLCCTLFCCCFFSSCEKGYVRMHDDSTLAFSSSPWEWTYKRFWIYLLYPQHFAIDIHATVLAPTPAPIASHFLLFLSLYTHSLPQHCVERCSQWVSGYMDLVVEFPHIQFFVLFTKTHRTHIVTEQQQHELENQCWIFHENALDSPTICSRALRMGQQQCSFEIISLIRVIFAASAVYIGTSRRVESFSLLIFFAMCPRPSTQLPQSCTHWHSIGRKRTQGKISFLGIGLLCSYLTRSFHIMYCWPRFPRLSFGPKERTNADVYIHYSVSWETPLVSMLQ